MNIFLLVPNMFCFKGGIQVFSRFFLDALMSFPQVSRVRVALLHDAPLHDEEKHNIPHFQKTHFLFFGAYSSKIRRWCYALGCFRSICKERSDLLLCTHLHLSPIAWCIKILFGTPYGIVLHGVEAWGVQNVVLRYVIKKADMLICVSDFTRERVLEQFPEQAARAFVLANTFQEGHFQLGPKQEQVYRQHGIPLERKIILTVARLDASLSHKGYDVVIRCLPRLLQKIPQAHYLIVGKGADRKRLEELIVQHELHDHVTLAGFIPDEQLPAYFQSCEVFILPSNGEGFGIVHLEALACGRPVIGSKRDGSVDALAGGKLGLLVDPYQEDEVYRALLDILSGTSTHPLVFQAQDLHDEVVRCFGREAFRKNLSSLLFERTNLL